MSDFDEIDYLKHLVKTLMEERSQGVAKTFMGIPMEEAAEILMNHHDPVSEEEYLVWSHEHGCWWGPNRCGYTRDLMKAGRYSRDEAIEISGQPRRWPQDGAPSEIPVRYKDAEMCKIRSLIGGNA